MGKPNEEQEKRFWDREQQRFQEGHVISNAFSMNKCLTMEVWGPIHVLSTDLIQLHN